MQNNNKNEILNQIEKLSSQFDLKCREVAIILAAGHGKRLKSEKSKMLHTILGIPTVERVYNACLEAVSGINLVVVIGIKALDVMEAMGKRDRTAFAYQEVQLGTGHAVQVALAELKNIPDDTIVYILPGDMGLIDAETIKKFRDEFLKSHTDMTVLTGLYDGNIEDNYYGRIVRVKDESKNVIRIMEHKDIKALPANEPYRVEYKGKEFTFTKEELLKNNEYNSGVFAFKYGKLKETISELKSENVQNEIYLTDLIDIFNRKGYSVSAMPSEKNYVVMGFNTQEVLQEMNEIARKVYGER
jgi:bifunctional UDP-N-acetylglucosamine pyrophosphorylase / glucosamine-1-phosphate N-acetyltransferase